MSNTPQTGDLMFSPTKIRFVDDQVWVYVQIPGVGNRWGRLIEVSANVSELVDWQEEVPAPTPKGG